MTDIDQPMPLTHVDQAYIDQERLRIEGLSEPERSTELNALAELSGGLILPNTVEVVELNNEVNVAELAQIEAARHIDEARRLARAGKMETAQQTVTAAVDFDKIGFIDREGTEEVTSELVRTDTLDYILVNLIPMSPATAEQFDKLQKQSADGTRSLGEQLAQTVKESVIPKLDENIRTGKNLRPIAAGNRTRSQMKAEQSLNTSYPAYKEGVQSTKNRAIIMRLGEQDGKPVYALAALYDHDDDRQIHRNLFLKQK